MKNKLLRKITVCAVAGLTSLGIVSGTAVGFIKANDASGNQIIAANNGNNGNGNGNGNGNATTGTAQTVYLKGSGGSFNDQWKNVFTIGNIEEGSTPNVWHLVYSGKIFNAVTEMQITFTNGEVFKWTPDMGPSTNNGGNNFGWVIQAPCDWVIAYVNKGNNNESESYIVTTENGNVNFNISGFKQGIPAAEGALAVTVDAKQSTEILFYKEVIKREVWNIFEREVWKIFERNVWDIYERDVWDILERDVWDIFERDVWKIYERNVWDIYERDVWDINERDVWKIFEKEFYDVFQQDIWEIYERVIDSYRKPVFEKKVSSNSTSTLVSKSDTAFNNGHTWVAIDVAAATEGILTFEIADSSKSNRTVGYSYNVTIEDGKLVVFFDDRFISANYGAYVVNNPSQFPGNAPKHPAYGSQYAFDMPANYGATVYLYFHNAGGIKWYTTGQYEFVKWVPCTEHEPEGEYTLVGEGEGELVFVQRVYGNWVKVGNGATEYVKTGEGATEYEKTGSDASKYEKTGKGATEYEKTGEGASEYAQTGTGATEYEKTGEGASKYKFAGFGATEYAQTGSDFRVTGTDKKYVGEETEVIGVDATFRLVITSATGKEVFSGDVSSNTEGITVSKLKAGVYTLAISYNGNVVDSKTVTVVAKQTVSAAFEGIYISGGTKEINVGTVYQDTRIDDVLIDNKAENVYSDKEIAAKYKNNRVEAVKIDNEVAAVYKNNKIADQKISNKIEDVKIDNKIDDENIDNKVGSVKNKVQGDDEVQANKIDDIFNDIDGDLVDCEEHAEFNN